MSRLETLVSRYERLAGLVMNGVELDAVGDPPGARLNAAVWRLLTLARDDSTELWDDVLGATKALRWRLLTQPQPVEQGSAVQMGAADVVAEAARLRAGVGVLAQNALDELTDAAVAAASADRAVPAVLLDLLQEATADACVVIAGSGAAAAGLENWLGPLGFRVRTASQLTREQLFTESGYAVGPPRFFPASLVNAPMTETLNFVYPSWFGDQSLPQSVISTHAEGAATVPVRVFRIGEDTASAATVAGDDIDETQLLPQASWIPPDAPPRAPGIDEVAARNVLLSGGYSLWLDDDGERIRVVDPSQPGGERVINIDIEAVRPGIYLLLRDGETERQALYEAALNLMGPQAEAVAMSQTGWKRTLQSRIDQLGRPNVVRELGTAGVKTLDRVTAWTDPMLARPRSNQDFETLLQWLGIGVHPTYELATALRRKRAQASVKIGDELEEAVGVADMSLLERDGHLRLDAETDGFRGVIATRILSISPHVEVISRHDARQLRPDRSARWLE